MKPYRGDWAASCSYCWHSNDDVSQCTLLGTPLTGHYPLIVCAGRSERLSDNELLERAERVALKRGQIMHAWPGMAK